MCYILTTLVIFNPMCEQLGPCQNIIVFATVNFRKQNFAQWRARFCFVEYTVVVPVTQLTVDIKWLIQIWRWYRYININIRVKIKTVVMLHFPVLDNSITSVCPTYHDTISRSANMLLK